MNEYFRLDVHDSALALVGELDIASVPAFEKQVFHDLDDLDRVVVFDLSRLTFIDAQGLTSFIKIERHLRDAEKVLVIRNPSLMLRRILDVTGLTWLLECGPRCRGDDEPQEGVRSERETVRDEHWDGTEHSPTSRSIQSTVEMDVEP